MKQQHELPGSSRRISCQRLWRTARPVRVMKCALGLLDLWQLLERRCDGFSGVFMVLQIAGHVFLVCGEVEEAVAALGDHDALLLARFLALEGLVYGYLDRVGGLRRGQGALGAGKGERRLEGAELVDGPGFDDILAHQE